MRGRRWWAASVSRNSLQPLPDTACFQQSTVADEELGCAKIEQLPHAGPDLAEIVCVVRIAGLASEDASWVTGQYLEASGGSGLV